MSYRYFILIILAIWSWSCATKPATTKKDEVYSEDLSSYRPVAEPAEINSSEQSTFSQPKGPYVPATHDINGEMDIAMDSLIAANENKIHQTYTIQVYLGRSREDANQAREKVYRLLPDTKPELSYKQPSWRVTVGVYLDRVDAYKTLNQLKPSFPGASLVPENHTLK